MNVDDKNYLYLALDRLIVATVPVKDDLDQAIVSAVGAFANYRGTAQWIDDAEHGSPRRYENSAAARSSLLDNQTVVDIFLRSGGQRATNDYAALASDQTGAHFSLIVVNAEAAYSEAIVALRTAIATSEPRNEDATYDIQVLKDAVVTAGQRALSAHPPIDIDFHSDIDAILAESAWRLAGSRIVSRVSGIRIGAWTGVEEWEMVPAVRFKFQFEDDVSWRDAYAFVGEKDGEWKVASREVSWLHERKRQYRINDAQIAVIHQLLEELGIRKEW